MDDSSSDDRKAEFTIADDRGGIDGSKSCDVCGSRFTQRKNLLRHRRMKHGLDIIRREDAVSKRDGQLVCSRCPAAFSLRKNLLRHVRTKHEPISDLTAAPFECYSCGFRSPRKDLVKEHIVRRHVPDDAKSDDRTRCPLCGLRAFRHALVKHFTADHDVEILTSSHEFDSESQFADWKVRIEKENANEFTKIYQYTSVDGGKFELYRCHRDGFYKARGRNLRRRTDSNKIGGHCPSSMRVKANPFGKVEVAFCRTHVGHLGEENRLRAIKRERRRQLEEIRRARRRQRIDPKFDSDAEVAHEIIVRDVDLTTDFHYGIVDEYGEEIVHDDASVLTILAPGDDLKFADLDAERRRLVDFFAQIVSQAETADDVAFVEDSMNSLLAALQDRQSAQFQRQLSLSVGGDA
ncbi:ZnF_C2H2 [Nesidiocoris tenuis]|uniref:ZnF_C2H2 n=1 Tax=Nesidiocoris tenuis TaxID=355587 RepID=A0ABN7AVL3_9HEMI|nr:ZnF_C2H2 [Nesidiocoris tenuis]